MIYAMSDIHGCYEEFLQALELIDLSGSNKLLLLGDYIHGGVGNYEVLDTIIKLQWKYGSDKVIALMGNHEEMVIEGRESINISNYYNYSEKKTNSCNDDYYINWMENLPRYYVEGKTIFVHAGIDEEAEDLWELGTDDYTFTEKYPAEIGKFNCSMKIVAGHVGTAEISNNPRFHEIYFDGQSHYYIDGTVVISGKIPVIAVDTKNDKYYSVADSGLRIVEAYREEGRK